MVDAAKTIDGDTRGIIAGLKKQKRKAIWRSTRSTW